MSELEYTPLERLDPVQADFRNFLFLVWMHLNLPVPTPVQYDIAQYLQKGPKRSVIEAFRGVGKSWITSAFVCWLLLRNPQLNIMVVSAAKDRADSFSTFTKRLIAEMPILAHLQPRKGQRDSNIAFDVGPAGASQSPSVKSVGITGQLTGSRADVIIADDVESLNNAMTVTMRDLLGERIKEFDAVLKPGGRVIYLGTPQTEMSIYNRLPERGYEIRIWPARVPENPDKYQGRLAPFVYSMIENGAKVREPVDPARFHDADLIEREASYGRSGFALQFMLDTSLSDADRFPLKFRDLIVHSCDPRMAPSKLVWSNHPDHIVQELPMVGLNGDRYYRAMWAAPEMEDYSGSVMAIDPSGRGSDETTYAVVKILNGNLYVLASGGFKDGYGETTLKSLSLVAQRHQVNHVLVEANFGDGMFTQLLKPVMNRIHPVMTEEVKHHNQKERRICDTLEPIMNQHRLVIDEAVIKADAATEEPIRQLMYQMARITRDKGALGKDDRLDVLAMAVAYWAEAMARDTDKAHEEHLEKLRDEELRKFMELACFDQMRSQDAEPTWLN